MNLFYCACGSREFLAVGEEYYRGCPEHYGIYLCNYCDAQYMHTWATAETVQLDFRLQPRTVSVVHKMSRGACWLSKINNKPSLLDDVVSL